MTAEDLRQRIADLMPVVRDELAELVALRSVADPRQFPAEECERAASSCKISSRWSVLVSERSLSRRKSSRQTIPLPSMMRANRASNRPASARAFHS